MARVWNQLDSNNTGSTTIEEIAKHYCVLNHSGFQNRTHTKEQVLGEFLQDFEGCADAEGRISKQAFFDYYADMSTSCPNDQYFVRVIEQSWCVLEDESQTVFSDRVHHLLALIRQRLISVSNQTQEENKLRRLFNEYDLGQTGAIDEDSLEALLAKLGFCVERKYLTALMHSLDKNKTGAVEFEEFCTFIIYDPYK